MTVFHPVELEASEGPGCGAAFGRAHPDSGLPWEGGPLSFRSGVRAFSRTAIQVLLSPGTIPSRMSSNGSSLRALGFAWLCCLLGALARAWIQLQRTTPAFPELQALLEVAPGQRLLFTVQGLTDPLVFPVSGDQAAALGIAASAVLTPVRLICASALGHLLVHLFGGHPRSYGRSFRLFCYATAPALLAWIPWVGWLAALYSWGLAMAFALMQPTSTTAADEAARAAPSLPRP